MNRHHRNSLVDYILRSVFFDGWGDGFRWPAFAALTVYSALAGRIVSDAMIAATGLGHQRRILITTTPMAVRFG